MQKIQPKDGGRLRLFDWLIPEKTKEN
ncbi:hypothetical protein B14911_02434 [Bacillus sp. NRRL B-14911]|nr:hypothetical protein B14911_02434 [Bacillus sp. NRRL B-14911]